jgi:hypothetical protein
MKDKFEPDAFVRKIILDDHEIESLQKTLYFLKGVELATPNSQYMHSVISEVIESVDYVVRQYWNAPIATEQDFKDRKARYEELDLIPTDELLRATRQYMNRMKKGKNK